MKIKKIPVGYLQANCYVLSINDENIVIDPGSDYELIKNNIFGSVNSILITHNHFDHVGALNEFKNNYNCDIYDFSNLEEKKYKLNNFEFEVIYTPGHTDDSITYYFYNENIMFTGDFLFKETIGRTDLKTGNFSKMLNSLKKIVKYKDCIIYPGHGEETNLLYEKNNNKYIKDMESDINGNS